MPFKAPKGTQDLLPSRSRAWERFVAIARETFSLYGYEPIETPVFEHSDLFTRGCGEDTDVATKEMFSVHSMGAMQHIRANEPLKADQRLALRPEGTVEVLHDIHHIFSKMLIDHETTGLRMPSSEQSI